MDSSPHILIQAGFVVLTVIFFGLLINEFKKALTKSAFDHQQKKKIFTGLIIGLVFWAGFVSAWSLSGRMANFSMFPLNVLPVLIIPLITILAITFSKTFREIIIHVPAQSLVRLQSFRFFVEILLWALFMQNQLPVQMTFEGRNFDVLSGLSAPIVAYLISRQKLSTTALLIWNVLCLGLLLNILGTAILSMPTSLRQFMNEPASTIVNVFPVSWLPGFLVPLAYGLHFFSLRQLAIKKSIVLSP
jgi:hypothetical protein